MRHPQNIHGTSFLCLLAVISCGSPEPYFPAPFTYHSVDSLGLDLLELAEHFPAICSLESLGNSRESRPLWAVHIDSPGRIDGNVPVVLIEGGIHGGEWIGTEVAFHVARYLCESYGQIASVTAQLDGVEIWLIPLVNPDGHARVEEVAFESDSLQAGRKNAADPVGNCKGVNLNRNFDYLWPESGSDDPCNGDYRGPSPLSEPESRALYNLLVAKAPVATLHYHAFGEILYYTSPIADESLEQLTLQLANNLRDAILAVYDHYYLPMGATHKGMAAGWVAGALGVPALTVELRPDGKDMLGEQRGGFALPEAEIEATFVENLPGALLVIDYAIGGETGTR